MEVIAWLLPLTEFQLPPNIKKEKCIYWPGSYLFNKEDKLNPLILGSQKSQEVDHGNLNKSYVKKESMQVLI